MTDDTRIRTYTGGRDKGERTRGPDESITLHIYHELSSSFMASQQWETRKQKCGIYTPVARKVSTFIIAQITICYAATFLFLLRMLLLRNAGKRSDRWRIFEIRVCMSFPFFLFFKSKRHVSEEVRSKCQFKFSVILSLEIHCIIDLNNVKSNHSINYYFE